jgi:imipenem/basic amino acid-specific outer membrane pore
MKLIKLSLAAMIAFGTCAVASSDTVYDAFSNGKVSGELRAYFFDRNSMGSESQSIVAYGTALNYSTDSLYGLKATVGVQTSDSPWITKGSDTYTKFKGDMYGSGAVVSNANLEYTFSKTSFKLGRQYMEDTDFTFTSGSITRIVIQALQGITIKSKEIPNTTINAAYVDKWQNRTDGSGGMGEFTTLGDNVHYAYEITAINKSIPKTTVRLAYAERENSYTISYAAAKYANKLNKIKYNASGQYQRTDYEASTTKDASFYGMKLGASMGGLRAYVAFAEVLDGTAAWYVAGHGSKPLIYTWPIVDAGQYEESTQIAGQLMYALKKGTFMLARYSQADMANATKGDGQWFDIMARYTFNDGFVKGLSGTLLYENEDRENGYHDNELRLIAKYKF